MSHLYTCPQNRKLRNSAIFEWYCACSVNRRIRRGGMLERSLCAATACTSDAQPEHWRSHGKNYEFPMFTIHNWLRFANFHAEFLKKNLSGRDFSGQGFLVCCGMLSRYFHLTCCKLCDFRKTVVFALQCKCHYIVSWQHYTCSYCCPFIFDGNMNSTCTY